MFKKFCPHSGCKELIDISQQYCDKHLITKTDNQIHYDKKIRQGRDKQYYDFYHNDKQWQVVRLMAVNRDHALCQECLKQKCITPYHVVHHRKAIKTDEGWRDRYKLDGLVCVCEYHHKRLEKQMSGGKLYGTD